MTQPSPQQDLSPAQMAALLALVQAQAANRQEMMTAAARGALAVMRGFTAWWDGDAISDMISRVLRIVQPIQRQAVGVTDAYLTNASSIIIGARQQPAGAMDVRLLRKAMTDKLADEILSGARRTAWVELGNPAEGPGGSIDLDTGYGLEDDREYQAPEDAYGKIADNYRFNTTVRGDEPLRAQQKAEARIAVVASTDVTLAVREQYRRTMSAQDATGFRRILHPELSQSGPCGLCVVAADRVYKTEDLLPLHNRCVPAGTRVAAEGVRSLTRRRYSGTLVILTTASGQELTITAKHPVLTDRGWIPAHLVEEDDHVVRHRTGHGVVGRGPDEDDMPPLVEDVWRAAVMSGAFRRSGMPVAAEDFHGDGSDGEVEAVSTYGLFPNIGDVSFAQPGGKPCLVSGHGRGLGLPGASTSLVPGLRNRSLAARSVGSPNFGQALVGCDSRVVGAKSLGYSSELHLRFDQAPPDRVPVDAVLLGERVLGGSGYVLSDNLGVGERLPDPPRFDPDGFEFAGQGRHAYAELGRDLRDRLASDVELDRVVDKRLVEGTHHVYNLHTDEGWYSANGLIVSNCVCEVLPVYGKADPGITLNGDDLNRIYDAAGGNTREALRRVRVVLTEHGELGPILVHGEQHYRGPEEVARNYASSRAVRERAILDALYPINDQTRQRAERGEELPKSLRWQQERIEELERSLAR